MELDDFPDEIIVTIGTFLDTSDLLVFNTVSQRWRQCGLETSVIYQTKHVPISIQSRYKTQEEAFHEYGYWIDIYRGIEDDLDIFHCLGRAIKKQNLSMFLYFLDSVNRDNLDVDEFATLFDLLAIQWNKELFIALLHKFLNVYRQHYHINLFRNLDIQRYEPCLTGFPQPTKTGRGNYPRAVLHDISFEKLVRAKSIDTNSMVRYGHKWFLCGKLCGKEAMKFPIRKGFSYEIRNYLENIVYEEYRSYNRTSLFFTNF